jgi:hypothetical protein
VEYRLGILVVRRVDSGFLDDQGPSRVDLAWCPQVLDIVEGSGRELVKADAVAVVVDDRIQRGDQARFVLVGADDLEDRLLDAVAVGFADPCDTAQAGLTGDGGGVDVVGDQQVQGQVTVQGR